MRKKSSKNNYENNKNEKITKDKRESDSTFHNEIEEICSSQITDCNDSIKLEEFMVKMEEIDLGINEIQDFDDAAPEILSDTSEEAESSSYHEKKTVECEGRTVQNDEETKTAKAGGTAKAKDKRAMSSLDDLDLNFQINNVYTSIIDVSDDIDSHNEQKIERVLRPSAESTYQCAVCPKSFNKRSYMVVHARTHSGEKRYSCDVCQRRFRRADHLRVHKRVYRDGRSCKRVEDKPIKCGLCERTFNTVVLLRRHMDTHAEKKCVCEVCGRRLRRPENLKIHMRQHTGAAAPNTQPTNIDLCRCKVCDKAFHSLRLLDRHVRTHTDCNYVCKVCERRFTGPDCLKTHLLVHRNDSSGETAAAAQRTTADSNTCQICAKQFQSARKLWGHLASHQDDKHLCPVCHKGFYRKNQLGVHMRTHQTPKNNIKDFRCEICEKTFTLGKSLTRHMLLHNVQKKYDCEICGKSFNFERYVRTHVVTQHMEKQHACHICGQTFSFQSRLRIHLATHSTDKPYACDLCGRRFILDFYVKLHVRRVHPKSQPTK